MLNNEEHETTVMAATGAAPAIRMPAAPALHDEPASLLGRTQRYAEQLERRVAELRRELVVARSMADGHGEHTFRDHLTQVLQQPPPAL